ncbi:uncharacterized protein LOC134216064 [Armigeres subalbatus]|uniref:uncharacterized protein LOC134216064 n=1 Tax=Armigeres subalbatus TaxID=124917 RepID=UPI002ED01A43
MCATQIHQRPEGFPATQAHVCDANPSANRFLVERGVQFPLISCEDRKRSATMQVPRPKFRNPPDGGPAVIITSTDQPEKYLVQAQQAVLSGEPLPAVNEVSPRHHSQDLQIGKQLVHPESCWSSSPKNHNQQGPVKLHVAVKRPRRPYPASRNPSNLKADIQIQWLIPPGNRHAIASILYCFVHPSSSFVSLSPQAGRWRTLSISSLES